MTYNVLPTAFAAQLDWLRDHGYTTILPRDLAAHWDRGAPLPARPVIITFDDGSRDWLTTVRPMLKQRGMVAEFYLTLDAIKHGNVTWDGVRRLAAAGNGDRGAQRPPLPADGTRAGAPRRLGEEAVGRGQRRPPDHRREHRDLPGIRWPTSAAATTTS